VTAEIISRVDRNKYQIQIPLPPKIDASVTMMQVEEKPDVTYSDVGGCKEQIEKLREVVETPLLHVGLQVMFLNQSSTLFLARTVRHPWNRPPQGGIALRASRYREDIMREGCCQSYRCDIYPRYRIRTRTKVRRRGRKDGP